MKRCSRCGELKKATEFPGKRNKNHGVKGECIRCSTERRDKNRTTPQSRHRNIDYILKWRYGITLAERDEMILAQGGKCKICGTPQSELTRTLSVDHDHATGKIRGLLCQKCNSILAQSNDSIDVLVQIIKYLENYYRT